MAAAARENGAKAEMVEDGAAQAAAEGLVQSVDAVELAHTRADASLPTTAFMPSSAATSAKVAVAVILIAAATAICARGLRRG